MKNLRLPSFLRRLQPTARARRPHSVRLGRHGMWVYRTLLALATVGLLTYLSPYQRPYSVPLLRLGATATTETRAPFLFPVYKKAEVLARERHQAEAAVPFVLVPQQLVAVRQLARLDSVFAILIPTIRLDIPDTLKQRHLRRELPAVMGALSVDAVAALTRALAHVSSPYAKDFQAVCRQILADLYATGIIPSRSSLKGAQRVRLGRRTTSKEMSSKTVYSADELRNGQLLTFINRYRTITERGAAAAVHELLSLFIEPNLRLDHAETRRLRDESRRGVPTIKRLYRPDELIVAKGSVVTAEHVEALEALASELAQRELANPINRLLLTAAAAIIAIFLTLFLGFYLSTREPEIFAHPEQLLLLALLVISTGAAASYVRTDGLVPFLTPTPLPAMLATILFNPMVGLVISFVLALFVGSLFADFYICLICALTAAVAVHSVRHVRHRNQFYRAIALLVISYSALIVASDLVRFVPLGGDPVGGDIVDHVLPGVFTGLAAPILTIGLLPIFESLFHITTDITLLELSDLNRPLLRELAIRAPGTYTHSLIMANLSESAAEAIGANPLHARVGCYYHDIGKILKPEYFTENQGLRGGRNPHDRLTPNMSMLIITSHVKDGLELAEAHGLPQGITDLIPQHHGTTVIEYFYNRAIELGDENVRQDDFRYDGPRPQTKEAGILMLADSVESAARSLTERTPNRVRQLVRHIVQQKFTAGELDECALTLQDLHKIEDSFIPVLMGALHGRVQYPWQQADRRHTRPSPMGAKQS